MTPPELPILFYDTETTGTSANAAMIELGARWLGGPHSGEHIVIRCRPHDGAEISPFALQANGYSPYEIASWDAPADVAAKLLDWLNETAPPGELIRTAAYNASFDDRFLRGFFSRHVTGGHALVGNMFDVPHCVMQSKTHSAKGTWTDYRTRFGSAKLVDVYRGLFKRNYDNAHNALPDVDATIHVFLCADFESTSSYPEYHHMIPNTKATQP